MHNYTVDSGSNRGTIVSHWQEICTSRQKCQSGVESVVITGVPSRQSAGTVVQTKTWMSQACRTPSEYIAGDQYVRETSQLW